jgi:DNA-binding response OmpR family regulator
VVSGEIEEESDRWLAEVGADARLPKPFELETFLETVQTLLSNRAH